MSFAAGRTNAGLCVIFNNEGQIIHYSSSAREVQLLVKKLNRPKRGSSTIVRIHYPLGYLIFRWFLR